MKPIQERNQNGFRSGFRRDNERPPGDPERAQERLKTSSLDPRSFPTPPLSADDEEDSKGEEVANQLALIFPAPPGPPWGCPGQLQNLLRNQGVLGTEQSNRFRHPHELGANRALEIPPLQPPLG